MASDGVTHASPFRGRVAQLVRTRSLDDMRTVLRAAGLLFALAAISGSLLVLHRAEDVDAHPTAIALILLFGVTSTVALLTMPYVSDDVFAWAGPWAAVGVNTGSYVLASALVYFVGSRAGVVAVFLVPQPVFLFMFFARRFAVISCVLLLGSYALALVALNQPYFPLFQWAVVASMVVGTGVVIGVIASRIDDLNSNLETRVAEQVQELERAGRLRRFLSPQIADVVTSEGADEMLAPHRADIAAFFVDLRGFTKFTNTVSAERVMRVLDEYYDAVGSILDAHGATIGGFDGDGVFAYLGDPLPHQHAASAAITMAQEIARDLDRRAGGWSDDQAALGYGIGLAYGEATLGLVGFANRADYTPVGAVVNLAARLCAEAKPGEILIDHAMHTAAELTDGLAARGEVDLKGFGATAAYAVAH